MDATVFDISDGGAVGAHTPAAELLVPAASATGVEQNLVRLGLAPIACWRVDDVRFDFGSSLVLPGVRVEMQMLAGLVARHTQKGLPPVLSLFGHADPVGDDNYNKALSGRRAAAIYGLLTRRVEVWEDLYANGGVFTEPAAGDRWGAGAIKIMARALRVDADSVVAPEERRKLFLSYMEKLAVDEDDKPFRIDPVSGFLGRRGDPAGKADFQGCGEFNPVLIFSKQEEQAFEEAEDKGPRNAANAPNRRVMALLFRPGSRVTPQGWPCPRAKEGGAACLKRFWSDGDARRERRLPDQDREYKLTKDTFGCRFYDRLSGGSPCGRHVPLNRNPVYFTVVAESVPVLDGPEQTAKQIGELPRGTLVRVVAESYTENAFYIRFERTDMDNLTYYDAPRPLPKVEWLCASKDGERFAYWANLNGTPLHGVSQDLHDRLAPAPLDV